MAWIVLLDFEYTIKAIEVLPYNVIMVVIKIKLLRINTNMKKFEPSTYSINDFLEWHERKQLVIQPKFQRRSVWKDVAKSFLIDSILRNKPLPKIFIRQITDIKTRKTIREVVDGQQRLRTIISYLNDGFVVRKSHNNELGGLYFSQLPDEYQSDFLTYKFSVDTLIGVDDSEIMDIFARLNTYTTTLNTQEKLNAKYYGYFKQLVFKLSHMYYKFWVDNKIFTNYQIMRMYEVALTIDLIITMIDGIQNRKDAEKYLKKYDECFNEKEVFEKRFNEIISLIKDIYNSELKNSNYRKPALFYSLFLMLYHIKYTDNINLTDKFKYKIKDKLDSIDIMIDDKMEQKSKEELDFITSISRATSDSSSRITRTQYLIKQIESIQF